MIVDVREPWELERAMLADVVAIPLGELAERVDEVPVSPGGAVVVVCHHGVRSLSGAAILAAAGRDAVSLRGGIDAWAAVVDPRMGRY